MRQSRFPFILVTVVLGFAAFVLSTCPPSSGDENLIVGTWVNPDYNGVLGGGGGNPAKGVYEEDGTLDIYDFVTDTVPFESGIYTITDQDGDIYRSVSVLPVEGTYYATTRVTSTTLEGRSSSAGYPPSPDPPDFTYTRQ